MIESIAIADFGTFSSEPETLSGLSKFNYLYGSNATGKTTISRVIADESRFPTCSVTWRRGTRLQPMVYSHDFVDRNFTQSAELKGVFTLGENQADTLAKITAAKVELDDLTKRVEDLTQALQGVDGMGGKKGDLTALEAAFTEKAWRSKQKLDGMHAQSALKHFIGSKNKFRMKVLTELDTNKSPLLTLPELEKRAESVFSQTPTTEVSVRVVDSTKLIAHETNQLLKKRVIGKEDVDIAAMIKKLGNSDWVRAGMGFYEVNSGDCPFCQQSTTEAFAKSLAEYFDETFLTDSKAIDKLTIDYATDAARLQQELAAIIASPSKFLDIEKLKTEKELLDAKITLNNQRLAGKRKEASQVVELESVGNIARVIEGVIDAANIQVAEHNKMVTNLAAERENLIAQVWRFVLEELKTDLADFKKRKDGLDKAISAMTEKCEAANTDRKKKVFEICELEKQTTSVQPTIDAINRLLAAFGFQSFTLSKAASGTSYTLLRPNGSDAKATLSEGEKTFVTFLYFYHLLKGSESDSGMTTDRIVVFDDPVSSLDSDILFIVSSLIRGLFDEVRAGTGHIKQVFVLTHNVYFHKEITFNPDRKGEAMAEETFWVIRRSDSGSKVEKHNKNPITTSYELLWAEVRSPNRSNLTIQNTLRRILENYFKILGGVNPEKMCGMFYGKEKLICKSLFSWINDGSHFAHDDLYVSIDESTVDNYLRVFREIFDKANHIAHYNMMMREADAQESAMAATA